MNNRYNRALSVTGGTSNGMSTALATTRHPAETFSIQVCTQHVKPCYCSTHNYTLYTATRSSPFMSLRIRTPGNFAVNSLVSSTPEAMGAPRAQSAFPESTPARLPVIIRRFPFPSPIRGAHLNFSPNRVLVTPVPRHPATKPNNAAGKKKIKKIK